jgi:hypothetical protein
MIIEKLLSQVQRNDLLQDQCGRLDRIVIVDVPAVGAPSADVQAGR